MDDGSIWRCMTSVLFSESGTAGSGMDFGVIAVYIILIVLTIVGGAYFAGAETALASVSRTRMKSYAEDGNKKAQYVMYILHNFDKALSTILIGNNIMHIACASIVTLLTRRLFSGALANHLDTALVVSTIITTIVVFLIAEMLPKCHAKTCSERKAMSIGRSLYVLMKALAPLAAVFTWIGNGFGKLFLGKKKDEPSVTEDDLKDMIESFKDEREEDEETEDSTAELMASALEFAATTAGEALTPWDKVSTISSDLEISEIYEIIKESNHTRFPMLNASGRVVGVLNIRAFLRQYMREGEDMELIDIIDTPLFIRPETHVDELLNEMSHNKMHMAFVTEQGKLLGIITIEDILEELVGEIFDETDEEAPAEVTA